MLAVAKGRVTGAMAPPWTFQFILDKMDSAELLHEMHAAWKELGSKYLT